MSNILKPRHILSSRYHRSSGHRAIDEDNLELQELALIIKHAIHKKTHHQIHGLYVIMKPGYIALKGHCRSFHNKQMAQEAVLCIAGQKEVFNEIQVK